MRLLLWCCGSGLALRNVVVLGPGAFEVKLCTAKIAAKQGLAASVVVSDVGKAQALMYGKTPGTAKGKTASVVSVDDIATALKPCEGLIMTLPNPTEKSMSALFENAPKLKRLAMLSSIGGKLSKAENYLRELCEEKKCQFSVVRVGVLKGGGPGEVATTGPDAGKALTDYGLSKAYYDTLVDLSLAQTTMAHDRFTLGADVVAGDPYKPQNFILEIATSGEFGPKKTDTNRVVAASSLVAAITRPKPIDITVSAASSRAPPTPAEWTKLLNQI